jgi:hypothetical protein
MKGELTRIYGVVPIDSHPKLEPSLRMVGDMHVLLPVPSWHVTRKTFDFASTSKAFVMDIGRCLGKLNKCVNNTCT